MHRDTWNYGHAVSQTQMLENTIKLANETKSMRYYTVILVMFGFIEPGLHESDLATKARIKALRFSTAHRIGAVLNEFRSRWPVDCVPGTAMQYTSVAMFTLLENLEDDQGKQAFIESFIVLRALARRWRLARGILRLIQLTTMKMDAVLPVEAQILFRDFESELWKPEDAGRFSSLYPNFFIAVNQEHRPGEHNDEAELDRILEFWGDLDLSEQMTEYSTAQSTAQSTVQSTVQSTEQATETEDTSNDSNGNSSGH